jgi:hypothetical protein
MGTEVIASNRLIWAGGQVNKLSIIVTDTTLTQMLVFTRSLNFKPNWFFGTISDKKTPKQLRRKKRKFACDL